jgi:hypothetical protein
MMSESGDDVAACSEGSLKAMSTFCPGCGSEIVWGQTETGDRVALSLPPIQRYVFSYPPPRSVIQCVDTYSPHTNACAERGKYKRRQRDNQSA